MPDKPSASIILITANHLDFTRLCLESIYRHTRTQDFELIVVDNASTDETPAYLQSFAAVHSNVHLILNGHNAGFAAGCNQGAAAAKGQFLIFMHNDTVVTSGWLPGLLAHFQEPGIGCVSPATNQADSLSRIRVDYQGLTGMEVFAAGYTSTRHGLSQEAPALDFFCAAIPQRVYAQTGPLDERFHPWMFEDADYSLRLKAAGYRLLCAEGVFVHHWGGISATYLPFETRWRIFQDNRQKLEDKWGLSWSPPAWRGDLLADQLAGEVDEKISLANKVIENERVINDLHLELLAIRTSNSYKFTRLLWRLLERLAPAGSLRQRMGRSAMKGLLQAARSAKTILQTVTGRKDGEASSQLTPKQVSQIEQQLEDILAQPRPSGEIVVLLPSIRWHVPLFQRPQQLALAFARQGCLTIYCEHPGSDDFAPGFHKVSESLFIYAAAPLQLLKRIPSPLALALAYNRADLEHLSQPRVVYEYIDELSVFPGEQNELLRNHDALVREASVVVATADVLFQRVQVARPDAILAPNAVDAGFIRRVIEETKSPPEDIAAIVERGPVIGYYGALARWFNFNLWVEAARARPNYQFLLIGPDYDGSVRELQDRHLPNIHWLGTRPYQDLPRYLKYFDVATIPFRLNEITHSTSPIKLFEYMVAEKPVVTTAMRECQKYAAVLTARSEADFIEKLDQALRLQDDDAYRRLLRQTAEDNTWDRRARQILQALPERNSTS